MPRLGVEFVSKEAKDDGSASTTVPFEALGLARWPLLQVSAITKDVSIPPADWIKLEDMRTLVGKLQVRPLRRALATGLRSVRVSLLFAKWYICEKN